MDGRAPRRARLLALAALIAASSLCVTFEALRVRCIGDCRGAPLDCAEVHRWLDDVRDADMRGDLTPRRRVYRVAVTFTDDVPCGSDRWVTFADQGPVGIALAAAARQSTPTVLTLRYRNPDTGGGPVYLDVLGAEISGYRYWLGRFAHVLGVLEG